MRRSWPSSSPSNHNLFYSLFPTLTCKFPSPCLLSHNRRVALIFNPYLSSCHRGKQNAVAVETASREAAYKRFSVQTEAYIWPFPAWAQTDGYSPQWTSSLFIRQMERQTERQRQQKERKKDGRGRDWSLDRTAAVLSLSGHPISVAHCNTEHPRHFICALVLWVCPPHEKHTPTLPLHHRRWRSSERGQHSADEYWSAHEGKRPPLTSPAVRHVCSKLVPAEGCYVVSVGGKKSQSVNSLTCKRHHTFTQTGVTLGTRPQRNCKSDYGSSPQASFLSARDKPPFRATFLFTFAVR